MPKVDTEEPTVAALDFLVELLALAVDVLEPVELLLLVTQSKYHEITNIDRPQIFYLLPVLDATAAAVPEPESITVVFKQLVGHEIVE